MKETPEQVFKRVYYNIREIPDTASKFKFDMAELYHQERLKSILPSEQEIDSSCVSYIRNSKEHIDVATSYRQGFKDALTLLTKGR